MPKSKGRRKPKAAQRIPRRNAPARRHPADVAPIHPGELEGHGLAAPPWETYLMAVTTPSAPRGVEQFVERMPFHVRGAGTLVPQSYKGMTCLAEMAASADQKVRDLCDVMQEMAEAGFMAWDLQSQSVLLTIPDESTDDILAVGTQHVI